MKPPKSFDDFTSQFHADLELTHPDFASLRELYESFRVWHGDDAVTELAAYFKRMRDDDQVDLVALWFDSKADVFFSEEEDIRRLFEDFEAWAASFS